MMQARGNGCRCADEMCGIKSAVARKGTTIAKTLDPVPRRPPRLPGRPLDLTMAARQTSGALRFRLGSSSSYPHLRSGHLKYPEISRGIQLKFEPFSEHLGDNHLVIWMKSVWIYFKSLFVWVCRYSKSRNKPPVSASNTACIAVPRRNRDSFQ